MRDGTSWGKRRVLVPYLYQVIKVKPGNSSSLRLAPKSARFRVPVPPLCTRLFQLSLPSSAGRPRCQSPSNRARNLNNCVRGYGRCRTRNWFGSARPREVCAGTRDVPRRRRRPAKDVRLVVGNNYGFACKDIGIDIGWDRLSLENTCPEIVLRPAIPFGPDSRTMISSSLKWNDV